jgi:hypothetical protein
MVIRLPEGMGMQGLTFQPLPKSLAGFGSSVSCPISFTSSWGGPDISAMPPFPFSPYTFSAVTSLVFAFVNLDIVDKSG